MSNSVVMVPSSEVPDWGIGGVAGGALDVEYFLEALWADARHLNARTLLGLEYLTMLRTIILFRKKSMKAILDLILLDTCHQISTGSHRELKVR